MRNYIIHKILALLVLLAFTVNTSFSQKNYSPGYIIKSNGDTLFGLIFNKYLSKNAERIVFKLNNNDSPITYCPRDLNEFGLKKDVYIKAIIKSETLENKNDTVFLQTLFNGKKSLYYYKNNQGIERFFIKQGGRLELLISKNYKNQPDGTYKIEENKKYIEQLSSYLSDCSTGRLNLKATSYSKNGLISLFDYYYKCVPSYNYYKTKKTTTEFGALIGVSATTLEFEGEGGIGWVPPISLGNSIRPSAGVFFNIIFPWNQRKWSISNELLFSTYNFKGKYRGVIGPMQYYNSDYELGYSYLKINNLIRFTYPFGSVSVFLNGGISTGWAVVEKKTADIEYHLNADVDYYTVKILHDTRIKEHGFIIGSGIKYRKYSFEFRYELGDGMEVNTDFTSTTKRYFALIGYTF